MKRLLFIIGLALLLAGCGSAKKLTSSKQETGTYTETTTEAVKTNSALLVDTTKHSGTEITYTKIEFYPPEPAKEPEAETPPSTPEAEVPNKHPPNVGAVKSIETLTIKNESDEKGVTESTTSTDEARTTDITSEGALEETTSEEPTADPYRWRYILGILLLLTIIGTVGYFWLKKAGVFTKVGSFLKKIF